MRPERNSLIAIALLFMAGCSAHRQSIQTDSVSDATDPVPMPLRHADEYDFHRGDHEYDPYPSNGDTSGPSQTPVPPTVPMGEPTPAPPAIGISRVKSVSWLRGAGRRFESNTCGEGTSRDPGFIVPEGCNSSVNDRKANRHSRRDVKQYNGGVAVEPGTAPHGNHRSSLADPLQEDGWEDRGGSQDQRYSPDELLDSPSTLETPANGQSPQNVPGVPILEPPLPVPESATKLRQTPAIQPTVAPAAPFQQIHRGIVNQIVQPPMWPRLGSAAPMYGNSPVVNPPVAEETALPVIQPGRRI